MQNNIQNDVPSSCAFLRPLSSWKPPLATPKHRGTPGSETAADSDAAGSAVLSPLGEVTGPCGGGGRLLFRVLNMVLNMFRGILFLF